MENTCQRCHESLRDADRYCAVCGLPQLIYIAAEFPASAAVGPVSDASGAVAEDALGGPGAIDWRSALKAALTLAIPAGVLCLGLPLFGFLSMSASAALAVGLYARRARPAGVSAGAGVRIGIVTGVFASWLTISLCGIGLWVSRFVLHRGGEWDALWLSQVVQPQQQKLAEMVAGGAESAQVAQSLKTMMLSAEGRAGMLLCCLVMLSMLLVFFSIIGGAVGARIATPARRPEA